LSYYLQIIKDTTSLTGSQSTNPSWVDISEYDVPFDFYNTLIADADARMDFMESNALIFGDGGQITATAAMVANALAMEVGDVIQKN